MLYHIVYVSTVLKKPLKWQCFISRWPGTHYQNCQWSSTVPILTVREPGHAIHRKYTMPSQSILSRHLLRGNFVKRNNWFLREPHSSQTEHCLIQELVSGPQNRLVACNHIINSLVLSTYLKQYAYSTVLNQWHRKTENVSNNHSYKMKRLWRFSENNNQYFHVYINPIPLN